MDKSGLSDTYIYTQSLRVAGQRTEGVYIRQTTNPDATTTMCHLVIGYKPVYVTNNSSRHLTHKHNYTIPIRV